jgi:hypothetical protein
MEHLDLSRHAARECNCLRRVRFQRDHAVNSRPRLAAVGNHVPFLCLRVQLGNKLTMGRPGLTDAFRPHGSLRSQNHDLVEQTGTIRPAKDCVELHCPF